MITNSIPPHYKGMTIESLLARVGSDISKALAAITVENFIQDGYTIDEKTGHSKPGLIFTGSYGVGKSTLAAIILDHAQEQKKSIAWVDAETLLFWSLKTGKFSEAFDSIKDADLILLDGLGDKDRLEPPNDDERFALYQLINYRHNAGLPMLITTNLTAAEIGIQFGQRTVERILEACAWVKVGGENLRFAPTSKARPTP